MKKVELRMREEIKYLTIRKLVETNGNKKRVTINLNCTIRSIDRMIARYKAKGKDFFVHGNRGRIPAKALSEKLKNGIEQLYLSKYYDCNYTVFTEFLAERENIFVSIDEVRVLLRDRYILSPRSHKSTRKRLRKQLLKNKKELKQNQKKKKYKLILLLSKMLILGNLDANILEKKYKWMLVYIFGLEISKPHYMLLLMMLLETLLGSTLTIKKL